ncbi:mor transcription activator family protein [Neisseria sp. N95_16]|uniref:Mor transcription activator family protein n=1 Tax=Neisseria brasiliensis TaxID=2666100 RepID=A0A5Q3S209_9NEIS|nr:MULTISPECIES: Mor transcription activator family protein [Neisseria]MRN38953.1 mor transcription activator family protein [Neisseria brasiliensis]MRN39413.1 mor transcription activator family protein [Neisseria brasiliensis]PJO08865.1 mor transcription activator family protein [Neisseria sp. N95_16]PJO78436.1 mor transcription activator family protein [Neisseria sp. N177_16]QGL26071.1 mor transcription activator family protein [Neisseria brasiliensis]
MQEVDLSRVRHLLPETMVQIVDTIGVKAALDLVKAIGGARFKFGKGKNDTPRLNMLFTAIGEEKTYELLRVFGGEELYVPRCEEALRELRNEQFRSEFFDLTERQGVSRLMAMSALCPRYQISDRTGYNIVGSRTQAADQQHLF